MAAGARRRRAPRWLGSLLAAGVVLDVVGASSVVALRRQQPDVAAPAAAATAPRARVGVPAADTAAEPAAARRHARTQQVRQLLDRRAQAVLQRDRGAFLATVDPTDAAFVARQAAAFDNLAAVPLASWAYELDADNEQPDLGEVQRRHATEVWAPAVTLRYGLRGFDAARAAEPQVFTFTQRPQGWLVAADTDFEARDARTSRELWDFGPVVVDRGAHALVLGHPGSAAMRRQIAREADRAVPRVTSIWGSDWAQQVVILVPDTQLELTRIVDSTADLSQIAAVATAELTGPAGGNTVVGNRVVVNPENFPTLGALGRRVVLTHEITHVASRASTGRVMPAWLAEGLADYVGFSGTDVSVASAARELAAEVRAGRVPDALPSDKDFAGTNARLAQVYEMSWLACRLIVAQTDEATLLRLYRRIGASTGDDAARVVATEFAEVLHTTPAAFTVAWRVSVKAQLG